MLRRLVVSLMTVAVLGSSLYVSVASAQGAEKRSRTELGRRATEGDDGRRTRTRSIPEFDPATAGVIAVVIAGGGLLIARRRKR